MKVIKETVKDCGYGHSVMKSTVELWFKDSGNKVIVDISTAHKEPRLAETFVFLTHINSVKVDPEVEERTVFEWRGINHVHAVLELQKFEQRTISELLKGDK